MSKNLRMAHEEYLRRNLLVASAYGAGSIIDVVLKRLRGQRRPSKWLIKALEEAAARVDRLPPDLARWRDLTADCPSTRAQAIRRWNTRA